MPDKVVELEDDQAIELYYDGGNSWSILVRSLEENERVFLLQFQYEGKPMLERMIWGLEEIRNAIEDEEDGGIDADVDAQAGSVSGTLETS